MGIRGWISIGGSMAVVAAWIYLVFVPPPRLPVGLANGTYFSNCCDPIRLRNGQMFVQNHLVSYIAESDKEGPYVLTDGYVGVLSTGKFEISPDKYPLKIRLDSSTYPTAITIYSNGRVDTFVRQSAEVR